jgi:hypothetical protein
MARRPPDEDPFAGLGGSSLTPRPAGSEGDPSEHDPSGDEPETVNFPEPTPSRANVLAMLAVADDETDVVIAGYYVQRAIAESLLLIADRLDGGRGDSGL